MQRRLFWLLPLVFVVHDGEELFTMPAWLAAHRSMLDAIAAGSPFAARIVATAPTSTARAAVAIGLVFALLLVVTTGVTLGRARAWFLAYCSLLGLLFLHVFTHVAQAVFFRSYVPGLSARSSCCCPGRSSSTASCSPHTCSTGGRRSSRRWADSRCSSPAH